MQAATLPAAARDADRVTLNVCSLKAKDPQVVPVTGGDYYLVRFPYGAAESFDPHNMHPASQPVGGASTYPDARSGLIWPVTAGWGSLTAMVFWEAGSATEYRAQFVRDPLNLTTGADSTATVDDDPTPGGQYRHYAHEMFVFPNTPIGLMIKHSGSSPLNITLAEFKLAIQDDVAAMPSPPPLLPGKSFPG